METAIVQKRGKGERCSSYPEATGLVAAADAAKSHGKLAISSGVGAAVNRTGPPFVTAIVCSKWALNLRSSVDWVQWSRCIFTRLVPMLTIGSTAITSPG